MRMGDDSVTAKIQTSAMSSVERRSVTRAFIANTIPKNRSQAISVSVRMLDTSDRTVQQQVNAGSRKM